MPAENMTSTEKRAVASLSSIMSLRMIGLFMVLPVFSLYAQQLKGATPFLMGLAISIYGLFVALFQIPFGMLSDRLGRKPIIVIALLIFITGSFLAASAHSITLMIIGRALQGVGSVGSTLVALLADLTREEQRTKSMAILGISIGFSFSVAMLLGPFLTQWFAVNDLFYIAALLGLFGIVIFYRFVPVPATIKWQRDAEPEFKSFVKLLFAPELAKLNSGIFILHAIFTASFVVIPISLYWQAGYATNRQWLLYFPALVAALIVSFACIGMAERKQLVKPYFVTAIILMILALVLLWMLPTQLLWVTIALGCFFTGFTILEGFLPSLISRTAPAARKGSALGIFSCAQYLGIFVGGSLGGWLYGQFSYPGVYIFCLILALFWLVLAFLMQPPRYLVTRILRAPSSLDGEIVAAKLRLLPGMVEVSFIAENGTFYLKMERKTTQDADFIRLKEQLQSE